MEFDLNKYAKNIESNIMYPKEELKNIIDENILNVVEKVTDMAKRYVKDIEENFYYCIAMHLNSTYDRLRKGKVIKNPQIDYIKREYAEEYEIAKILTKEINNNLNIELPEDEIGFITMYLKTFSEKDKKVSRVAVIVLTHGHVACGMAEVANKLLCTNLAIGIEMELDESPKIMLERTIEAVRKSLIENSNLYEIYKELEGDKKFGEGEQCVKKYLKTIITVCLTGEGSALNIKKYIEGMLGESKTSLNIIPIGIANISNGKNEIMDVYKNNNVIAVVGTINPEIENVPFISFQDILKSLVK
ncbi:PRD domain-containing protein [Clostridium butyricum]